KKKKKKRKIEKENEWKLVVDCFVFGSLFRDFILCIFNLAIPNPQTFGNKNTAKWFKTR
ncbi:unnamed protein product, partial [Arabidopsis halleri]